jgi:hypothetical protein
MTNAEVRVLELRIAEATKANRAKIAALPQEPQNPAFIEKVKATYEGRNEGLLAALTIFREEFGPNGKTTRAA